MGETLSLQGARPANPYQSWVDPATQVQISSPPVAPAGDVATRPPSQGAVDPHGPMVYQTPVSQQPAPAPAPIIEEPIMPPPEGGVVVTPEGQVVSDKGGVISHYDSPIGPPAPGSGKPPRTSCPPKPSKWGMNPVWTGLLLLAIISLGLILMTRRA